MNIGRTKKRKVCDGSDAVGKEQQRNMTTIKTRTINSDKKFSSILFANNDPFGERTNPPSKSEDVDCIGNMDDYDWTPLPLNAADHNTEAEAEAPAPTITADRITGTSDYSTDNREKVTEDITKKLSQFRCNQLPQRLLQRGSSNDVTPEASERSSNSTRLDSNAFSFGNSISINSIAFSNSNSNRKNSSSNNNRNNSNCNNNNLIDLTDDSASTPGMVPAPILPVPEPLPFVPASNRPVPSTLVPLCFDPGQSIFPNPCSDIVKNNFSLDASVVHQAQRQGPVPALPIVNIAFNSNNGRAHTVIDVDDDDDDDDDDLSAAEFDPEANVTAADDDLSVAEFDLGDREFEPLPLL